MKLENLKTQISGPLEKLCEENGVKAVPVGMKFFMGANFYIGLMPLVIPARIEVGESVPCMLLSTELPVQWTGENGTYLLGVRQEEAGKIPVGYAVAPDGSTPAGIRLNIATGETPPDIMKAVQIQNYIPVDRYDGGVGYLSNGKIRINEQWLQFSLILM